MTIDIAPVMRAADAEFELRVDGKAVGTLEREDGRWSARLLLRDARFLGGLYSSAFGHGDTEAEAIVDAIKEGGRHRDALIERLAELEAAVGETVRQVQYS